MAVLDVEQVVIRGHLVLGVLLRASRSHENAVRTPGDEGSRPMGMQVDIVAGGSDHARQARDAAT
jgi:hypothetical protein